MKSCVTSCSTHQKSKLRSWSPQTCKTESVLHLVGQRRQPISPKPASKLEKRSSKSFCCSAKQNGLPSHPPCLLRPSAQDGRFLPRLSLRQLGQEGSSFLRPPSTDITSQHNQAGAAARSDELRIRSVLPSARCVQHCTISVCCSRLRRTVAMQTRHECGVQGQLPPPEHPQTSHVERTRAGNIHVTNEDVCGEARSTLSTHAGSSTLHGKPTPSQNSRPWASCTAVAQESSGRPHRQSRWVKERGRRKRRKSKVRKKGGSGHNSGWWKMRHLHRNRLVTSASPSHCLT